MSVSSRAPLSASYVAAAAASQWLLFGCFLLGILLRQHVVLAGRDEVHRVCRWSYFLLLLFRRWANSSTVLSTILRARAFCCLCAGLHSRHSAPMSAKKAKGACLLGSSQAAAGVGLRRQSREAVVSRERPRWGRCAEQRACFLFLPQWPEA